VKAFVADPASTLGISDRDVAEPHAAPGRAVVEVTAVSLNRGEAMHVVRWRTLPDGHPMGWDFAGVVAQGATDGSGPAAGTPVFGWSVRRGTWAERVQVDVDQMVEMPRDLGADDASTLGVAGLTALAALDQARVPLVDSSVVVTGASGGLGYFATQLAALSGARATAVMREDGRGERPVLAQDVRIEDGIDPKGPAADLIVETVGGDMLSGALRRVGRNGTVVTLGRIIEDRATLPAGWFHKNASLVGLTVSEYYGARTGRTIANLTRLGRLTSDGRLRTNITRVVDRGGMFDAIDGLLSRAYRGKVVVRFDAASQ
jgi:NADPH:quinone reductase